MRDAKTKSNLHYTRGITPKRVTSSGAHLCDLAPGYTAPKKRRSGGEPLATLCRFHRSGIEPQTSRTDNVRLATELTVAP